MFPSRTAEQADTGVLAKMSDTVLSLASEVAPEKRGGAAGAETAFLFVGVLALLLAMAERLLQDPDTHWHIAVGRWIWRSGGVPWTDPFSHTFAGAPWIAKEWLSQLIFSGAFAVGGWAAVVALAAVAIASSFALLFWWLRRQIHATAALAMAVVAIPLSAGQFTARPHVLIFPILVVWTVALVEAAERRSPPWLLIPVVIVWANLHGSFPIGLALAGLLAAEAVVSAARPERIRMSAQWAGILVACLLASCVSPYGHGTLFVTLRLFGDGEPLPYIAEWQPLAFDMVGVVALCGLILLALGLAFRPAENLFRILAVALLGFMMIRHTRFLSLFALTAPIMAAVPLARAFPRLAPIRRGRSSAPPVIAAAFATLVLFVAFALVKTPRPSPATTPEAALRVAREQGLTGPVYNDYSFGGYLIAEGVKTFIDGRTDQLFLDGFFRAENDALKSRESGGFARLLDRHGVTWSLVKAPSDAARHFDALGWRKIHADPFAVVYARP
jgi:hypothetical protein